jgi:hypothetical protein
MLSRCGRVERPADHGLHGFRSAERLRSLGVPGGALLGKAAGSCLASRVSKVAAEPAAARDFRLREAQPASWLAAGVRVKLSRSSRNAFAHLKMSFSTTWRRITLIRRALLCAESFMASIRRSLRPSMS